MTNRENHYYFRLALNYDSQVVSNFKSYEGLVYENILDLRSRDEALCRCAEIGT
jgi:hypothetical protein